MSRSYRFPDAWYAKFPAGLETSLAEALGFPPDEGLSFRAFGWRTPPAAPVRRSVLAAELRRRGWPPARANVAAAVLGRWVDEYDADYRRFAHRAARRHERVLIAMDRGEELGWRRQERRSSW